MNSHQIIKLFGNSSTHLTVDETLNFLLEISHIDRKESEESGEQFRDYHLLIRLIDRNNDGKIDKTELTMLVKKLKKYNWMIEDDELFEITFDLIDTNNDGKVDRSEMNIFISKFLQRKASQEELNKVFNQIDTNKDGFISRDEFLNIFAKSTPMIKQHFREQDKENSGQLSLHQCFLSLHQSNIPFSEKTRVVITMIFNIVDSNDDGYVNLEEYLRFVRIIKRCGQQDSFEKMYGILFDELDDENRFSLTIHQIKEFVIKQKSYVDDEAVNELMRSMDENGNGTIDRKEFIEAMSSLLVFC